MTTPSSPIPPPTTPLPTPSPLTRPMIGALMGTVLGIAACIGLVRLGLNANIVFAALTLYALPIFGALGPGLGLWVIGQVRARPFGGVLAAGLAALSIFLVFVLYERIFPPAAGDRQLDGLIFFAAIAAILAFPLGNGYIKLFRQLALLPVTVVTWIISKLSETVFGSKGVDGGVGKPDDSMKLGPVTPPKNDQR